MLSHGFLTATIVSGTASIVLLVTLFMLVRMKPTSKKTISPSRAYCEHIIELCTPSRNADAPKLDDYQTVLEFIAAVVETDDPPTAELFAATLMALCWLTVVRRLPCFIMSTKLNSVCSANKLVRDAVGWYNDLNNGTQCMNGPCWWRVQTRAINQMSVVALTPGMWSQLKRLSQHCV